MEYTFFHDGDDNIFNEEGVRVYDPVEEVFTNITDPNIVLDTITRQEKYLAHKPDDMDIETEAKKNEAESSKHGSKGIYSSYTDKQRKKFIDKMIESPLGKGNITRFARKLLINPRTTERWWKSYNETGEIPYKKSKNNKGPKSSISTELEGYILEFVDNDPQLFVEDIIEKLTERFQDFSISKSQLNHHLKNTMLITVKKPHFEAKTSNSEENLDTRFEWCMKWKDAGVDFTKNCVFIDEAGFHINMRYNWVRSASETTAVVKIPKTRTTSHTIIGAIHSSSVLHVVLKKPPPKPTPQPASKNANKNKRKGDSDKINGAAEIINDEVLPEADTSEVDLKPAPKGTITAHFIKFFNELLGVMNKDETLTGSYSVMDNASIHKSKPMVRNIESRGYNVVYLSPIHLN